MTILGRLKNAFLNRMVGWFRFEIYRLAAFCY